MVRLLSAALLSMIALSAGAQNQDTKKLPATQSAPATETAVQQTPPPSGHIDLTHDPKVPAAAPGLSTNQSLLLPAQQGSATQTYSTTQTTTGIGGTTQPVNATSTQFNLGGQKATTTIYQDNTGRMTGSGTSIQIGGK